MTQPIIKLMDVKKNFIDVSTNVFSQVNLIIEPGQLIAAKGTIGCGKTTLINLICGLIKPDSGRIYVDNLDITSMNYDTLSEFRANLFGIVPQKTNLVPELTITQNLELPLMFKGIEKEQRRSIVDDMLKKIGILDMSDRLTSTLSVGESEIISIARSMITEPPILLMDEPTEGLDPIISEMILSLIRGYSILNHKTVFVTTHDERILNVADRVINVTANMLYS